MTSSGAGLFTGASRDLGAGSEKRDREPVIDNILLPSETELTGHWELIGGKVVSDDTCVRIQQLTSRMLVQIAHDPSGWNTLYRDPKDSRLWELSYPHSEMHGGGLPKLTCISSQRARDVFGYGAA